MVIKMMKVANLGDEGYLFQCPDCKSITQTTKDSFRTPECDCDEKLAEEYFGKDFRENENYKRVMAKRISKTFV